MLELRALQTYYGLAHVLHGLSLGVGEGEVVALLGRNGAGKTTTLRSISGLTPPRSGAIRYKGRDIAGLAPHCIARLGIALVPETRGIFSYLSARENLAIAERKLNRGRQLSGGEQEMLSIGRALLLNPKLLILDEPSQGLAPLIVREVFRIVSQMRQEGISVLLVEQNARMSLEIADHAYVLDDGRIVYSGSAAELAADEARVQALAGASAEQWAES